MLKAVYFDLNGISTREEFNALLSEKLQVCGYEGRNLDALHDFLTELQPAAAAVLLTVRPQRNWRITTRVFKRMCEDAQAENPGLQIGPAGLSLPSQTEKDPQIRIRII